jgi:hypothetical protein
LTTGEQQRNISHEEEVSIFSRLVYLIEQTLISVGYALGRPLRQSFPDLLQLGWQ